MVSKDWIQSSYREGMERRSTDCEQETQDGWNITQRECQSFSSEAGSSPRNNSLKGEIQFGFLIDPYFHPLKRAQEKAIDSFLQICAQASSLSLLPPIPQLTNHLLVIKSRESLER